jgi:hypothetical protein
MNPEILRFSLTSIAEAEETSLPEIEGEWDPFEE